MFFDAYPDAHCEPELPGLPVSTRAALVLFWLVVFSCSFVWAWRLLEKHWPRFRKFPDSTKGDNCSRVNSTLHSLVVAPELFLAMHRISWGNAYEPVSDPSFMQALLTASVAYFLVDLVVVYRYKTPMWQVFMLHHVIACVPYVNYLFNPPCKIGLYVLGSYMTVEITNLTYNVKLWMQDCGNTRNKLYAFLLYATMVQWVIFRMVGPSRCFYLTHWRVTPNSPDMLACLTPGIICGFLVNVFCYLGFFIVFVSEAVDRWHGRGTAAPLKTVSHKREAPQRVTARRNTQKKAN